jgi:hypothetical protein
LVACRYGEHRSGVADAAIVDAYERAADVALAEIVANTSRTLKDSLEHP